MPTTIVLAYDMHMCTATSTSDEDDVVKVPFQIRVKLFKAKCANTVGDELQEKV